MVKPAKKTSETKITRIKASDDGEQKKSLRKTVSEKIGKKSTSTDSTKTKSRLGPIGPMVRYFKGSWYELRQVRWPDRRATWSMTGALLIFTAFFVVIILLLDAGFKYLFKLLIGN